MDLASFIGLLKQSRLLASSLESQLPTVSAQCSTATHLAELLVAQNWLTKWQAEMLLAGHTAFFLDNYRLVNLIGQGGMGAVFQAAHTQWNRPVAIKMMNANLTQKPDAVARFKREIQAAAALGQHPNIVCALDAGETNRVHFLVMEYVRGEDLRSVIETGDALSESITCEFVRQAALGLQHAHEREMVHRDIKPSNLLLTESDQGYPVVKILDMGLARFTSEHDSGELTSTGQVMGSVDYISPEQSQDSHRADIRSDIFSLGCTLFFLLTGKPPYRGKTSVEKVMNRVMKAAPRIRTVRPDISIELESIIARLLEREPKKRFQTPQEVADVLAPFAGDAGNQPFKKPTQQEHTAPLLKPRDDSNPTSINAGSATQQSLTGVFSAQQDQEITDTDNAQALADTGAKNLQLFLNSLETHAAAESTGRMQDVNTEDGGQRHSQFNLSQTSETGSLAGVPASTRRQQTDRRVFWVTAISIFAALASFVGWKIYSITQQTTVELTLAKELRLKATISIDDEARHLPTSGKIVFTSSLLERTIYVAVDGFQPIRRTKKLEPGEHYTFNIDNMLRPANGPDADLNSLREAVDTLKSKRKSWPPRVDDQQAIALHGRAARLLRQADADKRRAQIQQILNQLPGPFDQLTPVQNLIVDPPVDESVGASIVGVLGAKRHRLRHWRDVTSLQFSLDGRFLFTAGAGIVKKWDLDNDAELVNWAQAGHSESQIALSPDGQYLAVTSHPLVIFDAQTLKPSGKTIGINEGCNGVCFSHDGNKLAAGLTSGIVVLADLTSGDISWQRTVHQGRIDHLRFSPDDTQLATGGVDKTVHLLNTMDGTTICKIDTRANTIAGLDFLDDGRTLQVCPAHSKIERWKISDAEPQIDTSFKFTGSVGRAILSDDKSRIVEQTSGVVVVRNSEGAQLQSFPTLANRRTTVSISPDNKRLAFSNYNFTISVFDLDTKTAIADGDIHPGNPMSMAVSPDDTRIAAGWERRDIVAWTVPALAESPADFGFSEVFRGVRFLLGDSHRNEIVITGIGNEATAVLGNFETNNITKIFAGRLQEPISISQANQMVVADEAGHLHLWDLNRINETNKPTSSFTVAGQCLAAEITQQGDFIVSTENGENRDSSFLRIREIQTGKTSSIQLNDDIPHSIGVHPNGIEIATGSLVLQNFSLRGSKRLRQLDFGAGRITDIEYNPAGTQLAVAREYGCITLHDAETLQQTGKYQIGPPEGLVCEIHFSSDSRHLIAANGNGTVYILRLRTFPQIH